jgi:hypothetical protein
MIDVMKRKRAIGGAVLVALVASHAYWLGYQLGSNSSRATVNTPSKLRQIGLAFRHDRNTVSRFT